MNQSARKEFFEQHPDAAQIFETVDGVLFDTIAKANNWNGSGYTTLDRADYITEATAPVAHTVTEADLKAASSVAEIYDAKVGDEIQMAPAEEE